jgi:hypothetical protein
MKEAIVPRPMHRPCAWEPENVGVLTRRLFLSGDRQSIGEFIPSSEVFGARNVASVLQT